MNDTSIKEILDRILSELCLPFEGIAVTKETDVTRVDIESSDPSRIIGWHGETLNAIQHLLKSIIRSKDNLDRSPFIVLDIDGYRRAQEDKVRKIAGQKADFVRRTGNRVALAPMSPYFRRIVHLYVAENPDMQDMTTESTGEGDYRQVVLKLKNGKPETKDSGELEPVITDESGLENLDI